MPELNSVSVNRIGSIFCGMQRNGMCAILGDSITNQISSMSQNLVSKLGLRSTRTNYANGGTKIEDQAQHIPAIVAEGAKYLFLQIGTNNSGDADLSLIFGKYDTLLNTINDAGLSCINFYPPPRSSSETIEQYKINVCYYFACKKYGFPIYDPWRQFASASGGWNAPTSGGDNLHPAMSTRLLASSTAYDLVTKNNQDLPLIRSWRDSLLLSAGFETDSNADGVANNWTKVTVGTTSFARSEFLSGMYWQEMTITNPTSSDKIVLYQDVTVLPNHDYAFSYVMEASSGNENLNTVYAYSKIDLYNSSSSLLGSYDFDMTYIANGSLTWFDVVKAIPNCVRFRIQFGIESDASYTGVFSAKVRHAGLVNLTALNIPESLYF